MDERIGELLPFYALGVLTEAEQAEVETYIKNNAEARARLEEMIASAAVLPFAAEPVEPPAASKARLMARVNADVRANVTQVSQSSYHASDVSETSEVSRPVVVTPRPAERKRGLFDWLPSFWLAMPALAALSLLLAFGAVLWALNLTGDLQERNGRIAALEAEQLALEETIITLQEQQRSLEAAMSRLQQDNVTLTAEKEELLRQFEDNEAILASVTSENVRVHGVAGTEQEPLAQGEIIGDPTHSAAVVAVSGLPPLPAGSVYQLWLIEGSTPTPFDCFMVGEEGEAAVLVQAEQPVGNYDLVGVTIEPEQCSQTPSEQLVMLTPLSY